MEINSENLISTNWGTMGMGIEVEYVTKTRCFVTEKQQRLLQKNAREKQYIGFQMPQSSDIERECADNNTQLYIFNVKN